MLGSTLYYGAHFSLKLQAKCTESVLLDCGNWVGESRYSWCNVKALNALV